MLADLIRLFDRIKIPYVLVGDFARALQGIVRATMDVDLLIHPPIKSLKTESISYSGLKVRVATKETLLKMKRESNRDEDQLDIKKLEEAIGSEKK